MSDLSERIREIVGEIRDITAGFCSGDLDSKLLKSSDEWADQILALLKQEPVAWRHDFTCGHSSFTKQEEWDGTRYACGWKDQGVFGESVPLYAGPVAPEGERVEGWVNCSADDMPEEWAEGTWARFTAGIHHDPAFRRAILIFPEDKP